MSSLSDDEGSDPAASTMGIIRKLLIFATTNSLVVQAHGPVEHHKAIRIDYGSQRISECPHEEAVQSRRGPQLEVHGLIGRLSYIKSINTSHESQAFSQSPHRHS